MANADLTNLGNDIYDRTQDAGEALLDIHDAAITWSGGVADTILYPVTSLGFFFMAGLRGIVQGGVMVAASLLSLLLFSFLLMGYVLFGIAFTTVRAIQKEWGVESDPLVDFVKELCRIMGVEYAPVKKEGEGNGGGETAPTGVIAAPGRAREAAYSVATAEPVFIPARIADEASDEVPLPPVQNIVEVAQETSHAEPQQEAVSESVSEPQPLAQEPAQEPTQEASAEATNQGEKIETPPASPPPEFSKDALESLPREKRLELALEEVLSGRMSQREAARHFGVGQSTLSGRIKKAKGAKSKVS